MRQALALAMLLAVAVRPAAAQAAPTATGVSTPAALAPVAPVAPVHAVTADRPHGGRGKIALVTLAGAFGLAPSFAQVGVAVDVNRCERDHPERDTIGTFFVTIRPRVDCSVRVGRATGAGWYGGAVAGAAAAAFVAARRWDGCPSRSDRQRFLRSAVAALAGAAPALGALAADRHRTQSALVDAALLTPIAQAAVAGVLLGPCPS